MDYRQESDVIVGARNIGAALGISERAAFHLIATGVLPVRKICGRWFASRKALIEAVLPERDNSVDRNA